MTDIDQAKTEKIVSKINRLLESGQSELEIIRQIGQSIEIPLNSDLRLAAVKIMCRNIMFYGNVWDAPELVKHHVASTMRVIKDAMDAFLQQNGYHAVYSLVAYYEVPSDPESPWSLSPDWHYGSLMSKTMWSQPKITSALRKWLKDQPTTKVKSTGLENKATWHLIGGQCWTSIEDSNGNTIIKKRDLVPIRLDVKIDNKNKVRVMAPAMG